MLETNVDPFLYPIMPPYLQFDLLEVVLHGVTGPGPLGVNIYHRQNRGLGGVGGGQGGRGIDPALKSNEGKEVSIRPSVPSFALKRSLHDHLEIL